MMHLVDDRLIPSECIFLERLHAVEVVRKCRAGSLESCKIQMFVDPFERPQRIVIQISIGKFDQIARVQIRFLER